MAREAELFEALADLLSDAVLVFGPDGRVARANAAAGRWFAGRMEGQSVEQWSAGVAWLNPGGRTPLDPDTLPLAAALGGGAGGEAELHLRTDRLPWGRAAILGVRRLGDGSVLTVWRDISLLKPVGDGPR